jgi:hypothetical protein
MNQQVQDRFESLRKISQVEKNLIIKDLFDQNNKIKLKTDVVYIGKYKGDETYQAVLKYENKITNDFLTLILPNKSYADYFWRKDYHRDINELSQEMEKDIVSNLVLIKEILNIEE